MVDGRDPEVTDSLFGEGNDERGGIQAGNVLIGPLSPMLFGEDMNRIELLVAQFNIGVFRRVLVSAPVHESLRQAENSECEKTRVNISLPGWGQRRRETPLCEPAVGKLVRPHSARSPMYSSSSTTHCLRTHGGGRHDAHRRRRPARLRGQTRAADFFETGITLIVAAKPLS